MNGWHLLAFNIGWWAHVAFAVFHLRRVHREHESRINEVRIEERLRAKRIFDEYCEREAQRRRDFNQRAVDHLARKIPRTR